MTATNASQNDVTPFTQLVQLLAQEGVGDGANLASVLEQRAWISRAEFEVACGEALDKIATGHRDLLSPTAQAALKQCQAAVLKRQWEPFHEFQQSLYYNWMRETALDFGFMMERVLWTSDAQFYRACSKKMREIESAYGLFMFPSTRAAYRKCISTIREVWPDPK